jgi:7-cyano-7-deazaguanine synthase
MSKNNCVVSLSGGMDSSTLLLRALTEYKFVTGISFDYGQKHRVELDRAQSLVNYLSDKGIIVNYRQIRLDGLTDLLNSALVTGGKDVPEGHYENENMKETVVPNRNKMFASITQAVALSVANRTEKDCDIALGIHAGDHAIYPDCRQEFRDADYEAFKQGNWDAEKVSYITPYLNGDKFDILVDGQSACFKLGIDFDEVYKKTNTSYKPIKHYHRPETNAYEWYSDYKSASSVERIEAFIKLGRPDPVSYADETGPVDYKVAENHVKQLLENYEKS